MLIIIIIMACPRRSGSGDGTKRSDQEKEAIRGRGRGSTIRLLVTGYHILRSQCKDTLLLRMLDVVGNCILHFENLTP